MTQPTTFINPDPDFARAMGLAQSLVGGSAHITAGLGAVLATELRAGRVVGADGGVLEVSGAGRRGAPGTTLAALSGGEIGIEAPFGR